ncbi:MAG: UDP-N-acetylmuramoyl-L-alanyl-D-glutamate--2,6-diaminopimelate ligase [Heliobacteriaceae bacterium]|jgi:UDP-N-acetylmuramoyl-L-alanyl-D-glutamate--2,6-diaminopimelate ligase|nr:UDP-N-acetylmuramoyl-L-alanyl-D-glutamate--2,6-diaminopimelate ligase [Heliobacteriaceae bacterium]
MKLDELIEYLDYKDLVNFKSVDITGISYDSKTTKAGDIFVCLVGEHTDGHEYAQNAIDKGAAALLVERALNIRIPQIVVDNTRHKIADIADRFYSRPSMGMNFLGITGTNGKTTVTHLIQKIFEENNQRCALIGTLGYKLSSGGEYRDVKHTTPQAPELQATLRMIKDVEKIDNVVMEVSSHALEQNRVGGCRFNGAILTNLTQDHLDYHITMDKYFDAKAILFKGLGEGSFAVINSDDLYAERFSGVVPEGVRKFTYGVKNPADVTARDISFSLNGAEFTLSVNAQDYKVNLHMNGMFSVYNVLAAVTSAIAMGIDINAALKALENVKGVAGRFEVVAKKPLVIVDYAHTPDGLENVLNSAREITPEHGKLICLFGCGGDRDATKRPKMGAIAEKISDMVVITSDNPRSEDPQQIITDILAGLKSTNSVIVEADRGQAIALLKNITQNNDVVVIAGKGHEDYQILKDRTIHFDDREEARKVFEGSVI